MIMMASESKIASRDVLDEILDLIESVSGGFLSYSFSLGCPGFKP